MHKSFLYFILCLIIFQTLYSATTGKITGRVTDYQTGQGIMGVNVVLEGEEMGAATDQNGYYSILNIPPDQYSLKFSRIGYAEVVYQNVQVKIGLNTEINVEMQAKTVGMERLEVVASRPVVLKDVSNSRLDVDYNNIKNLPIKNVESVIGLQAGIENDLEIRGSDPSQTAIILDGLDSNNPRGKTPYTNYSLSAVKEIQVQTG
ncbi:MAG TPA: carboxypeptidase regulatory-like domain-containing protein, partial [bacterium]|nr:carboxypeptidase regulatory-like domain-containing protein [bacterium]